MKLKMWRKCGEIVGMGLRSVGGSVGGEGGSERYFVLYFIFDN